MILKPWFDVVLKIYASRFKACCSENPTACIHSWVGAQKNLQHDLNQIYKLFHYCCPMYSLYAIVELDK